jgi:STE24 endopeptidase
MPFLFLFSLMFACSPLDWPWPPERLGYRGVAITTWCTTLGWLISAWLISSWNRYRIHHSVPTTIRPILKGYLRARMIFSFSNLILLALEVKYGWARAAQIEATGDFYGRRILYPGAEVLVIAPFLVRLVGTWVLWYPVDRVLHYRNPTNPDQFWSRSGYTLFQLRQFSLIVFLPVGMMILSQGLLRVFPEWMNGAGMNYFGITSIICMFIFLPLFLPALLGLKTFPTGPLLTRFEHLSSMLRFRYRSVYLWDTRGSIANAMITGVIPRTRAIVLTDRLVRDLTRQELEAVFGHEVGHVHYHHLQFQGLFVLLSVMFAGQMLRWLEPEIEPFLPASETFQLLLGIGSAGLYLFLIFGFLSRRNERQADLFGCRVASSDGMIDGSIPLMQDLGPHTSHGIDALIGALKKTERINGADQGLFDRPWYEYPLIPILWLWRWLHTWQHGTIQQRVRFLERVRREIGLAARVDRRITRFRWLVIAFLIIGLVFLGEKVGWNM